MNYLTIITTVLVVTQIIRILQNAVQLYRQNKMREEQLKDIVNVTVDIQRQRKMQNLVIAYLMRKMEEESE